MLGRLIQFKGSRNLQYVANTGIPICRLSGYGWSSRLELRPQISTERGIEGFRHFAGRHLYMLYIYILYLFNFNLIIF